MAPVGGTERTHPARYHPAGSGGATVTEVYALSATHGDDLSGADHRALATIRRTMLGLLEHGFITELNTYSGACVTEWSYLPGTEHPDQILAGLVDTVRAIAPDTWVISTAVPTRPDTTRPDP